LKIETKPDIESDSYWHQDMGNVPALEDDSFSVHEVSFGSRSVVREILETVVVTLLLFLAVRLVVQNYMVEGTSMVPSLHDTQSLLVNKAAYFRADSELLSRLNPFQDATAPQTGQTYVFGPPQRGDIIVFHAPTEPRDFIKRVIGLPGETVEVRANEGVFINGQHLDEPYIQDVPSYNWPDPGQPATVPVDEIFVMGDNRNASDDSHIFGPILISSVVGKAWFCYWPFAEIGALPHPTYTAP
jgi:signal peptidase I